MQSTNESGPVQLRAVLIEHGNVYLCIAIGAGLLIPLVDRCLLDFDACDAAVKQATGRNLRRPAGTWHDELRRLINGRAAA